MEAIYGVSMSPNTMLEFTFEERVRLRRMLDIQDQKESGGMKEFDFNKPNVPPYQYREYPFLMYHHGEQKTRPARDFEERQRMLAEGWSEDQFPPEVPEVELTAKEREEALAIDKQLVKKKK